MHDVLRARLLRKIESLPEEQVYQVLDYIEFLESKYSKESPSEASGLQSFAEKVEDQLRRRTLSPSSLREAFQLIAAADKILSNVSHAGRELLGELNGTGKGKGGPPPQGRPGTPPQPEAGKGSQAGKDGLAPPGKPSVEGSKPSPG